MDTYWLKANIIVNLQPDNNVKVDLRILYGAQFDLPTSWGQHHIVSCCLKGTDVIFNFKVWLMEKSQALYALFLAQWQIDLI